MYSLYNDLLLWINCVFTYIFTEGLSMDAIMKAVDYRWQS